jgi:adenylate cyclase
MEMDLRFVPSIRYGTEQYPEKVARRLRAVNVAALISAASSLFFTIQRLLAGPPGQWKYPAIGTLVMLLIPLLHRFGPLAAPLAFAGFGYIWIFWLSSTVGTDGGTYFFYLTAAALGVLVLGTERVFLSVVMWVLAVAAIILLHLVVPRDTGLVPPKSLFYVTFILNLLGSTALLYGIVFYAVRQLARAEEAAERERQRSEILLLNILPPSVAERLKDNTSAEIADAFPHASILFADMAGFTARASDTAPDELVRFLNGVYSGIDGLVERHGLEKIKTTGDAYMVVSGVPHPRADHAGALAVLALDILDALTGLVDSKGRPVPIRIGIASGPVVAGVIGTRKFFYDVWGDAVNVASRMESTGIPGKIQVAPTTYELIADSFELEERGVVEVRGKEPMRTWFLIGRKRAAL